MGSFQNIQGALEEQAFKVGFDVAGWASAHIPQKAIDEYEHWLNQGFHAGMDYLPRQLERKKNLSPYTSVLVLGISHAFQKPQKPLGGRRVGRVAKYAWTPDYHQQLQPRLIEITELAQRLGVGARAYVDHGPVMERALAAHAFLGWRAKSGMLVSQKWGAFLTLAVVLTDLPHENPKEAHPDRCGRCRACIQACPTRAIGEDRTLDARKCLSYLTIEHRGPIPYEYRKALEDWLFGCDGCLEVCPWSIKAGEIAQSWQPDPQLVYPDIGPWFSMSGRQFDAAYAHSAFARPRRKGMVRNACLVLGNLQNEDHFDLLHRALKDPIWEIREAAAWALGRFASESAQSWLMEASKHEHHLTVLQTLQLALKGTFI